MNPQKILIVVKTYPTLSAKYGELVCTAGFREDGSWVRIYPVPFRKLEYGSQYGKYHWITASLERNYSDIRPESYKLSRLSSIKLGEKVGTGKDGLWMERKKIVLKRGFYTNLSQLISEAKDPDKLTSLAVFKPTKVLDFIAKKYTNDIIAEYNRKRAGLMEKQQQFDLFSGEVDPFDLVEKIPYKFSYRYEDDEGRESTMMIEDWETNQLYRKLLQKYGGNENKAIADVRKKYFDDFALTKDLYFYLGTTRSNHLRAKNPFIIIGAFHPKLETQLRMF